jgi:FMN phosphatase YigB (HAD superfamily)
MEREPLPLLARCLQPGLFQFLQRSKESGIRLAVLSDYPAQAKLEAMGLSEFFEVVVTAQSTDVGTFKPDPRGMRVVLERLGVGPEEVLSIGDRPDVDAPTAAALGIACFILSPRPAPVATARWTSFQQYQQLWELALNHRSTCPERSLAVPPSII